MGVLLGFGAVIALFGWLFYIRRQREAAAELAQAEQERLRLDAANRFAWLCQRFGEEIATKIVHQRIWQGATEEMTVLMLGPPHQVSEKVLKKLTRQVFMYGKLSRGWMLKVTIENGIVVGWEGAAGVIGHGQG